MFDVDQDEQGGRRGDRSTLYILDPGREIQFPAIARPCIGVQGVRRGKQNRREVVEFETARHAEFSDRVEQETEKIVDYGRHRAAVCYPGHPYVTLVRRGGEQRRRLGNAVPTGNARAGSSARTQDSWGGGVATQAS
ncbi:hypothetical protein rerp_60920 [Rhodococcus erythropolis]|nr:hypothetical protein rerp_58460 [Rhodococcus erythropolis]GCB59684.1 hypothetical protein rerp_60920 [Rhodococcus erythropolis]